MGAGFAFSGSAALVPAVAVDVEVGLLAMNENADPDDVGAAAVSLMSLLPSPPPLSPEFINPKADPLAPASEASTGAAPADINENADGAALAAVRQRTRQAEYD